MSDMMSTSRIAPSPLHQINIFHPDNDEKSFSSISSIYGKNSGIEVKTCAMLKEMINISVPTRTDQYWCILVSYSNHF